MFLIDLQLWLSLCCNLQVLRPVLPPHSVNVCLQVGFLRRVERSLLFFVHRWAMEQSSLGLHCVTAWILSSG